MQSENSGGKKKGFTSKTRGKKGAEYTDEVISHVVKCRKKNRLIYDIRESRKQGLN